MYDPYREEYHRPSPPSGKSKAAQASASLVNILSRAADALYNEYNEKPPYLQKEVLSNAVNSLRMKDQTVDYNRVSRRVRNLKLELQQSPLHQQQPKKSQGDALRGSESTSSTNRNEESSQGGDKEDEVGSPTLETNGWQNLSILSIASLKRGRPTIPPDAIHGSAQNLHSLNQKSVDNFMCGLPSVSSTKETPQGESKRGALHKRTVPSSATSSSHNQDDSGDNDTFDDVFITATAPLSSTTAPPPSSAPHCSGRRLSMKPSMAAIITVPPPPASAPVLALTIKSWIISRETNKIREENETYAKHLNVLKSEYNTLRDELLNTEKLFKELQHFVKNKEASRQSTREEINRVEDLLEKADDNFSQKSTAFNIYVHMKLRTESELADLGKDLSLRLESGIQKLVGQIERGKGEILHLQQTSSKLQAALNDVLKKQNLLRHVYKESLNHRLQELEDLNIVNKMRARKEKLRVMIRNSVNETDMNQDDEELLVKKLVSSQIKDSLLTNTVMANKEKLSKAEETIRRMQNETGTYDIDALNERWHHMIQEEVTYREQIKEGEATLERLEIEHQRYVKSKESIQTFGVDSFAQERDLHTQDIKLELLTKANNELHRRRAFLQKVNSDVYRAINALLRHINITVPPALVPFESVTVPSKQMPSSKFIEISHVCTQGLAALETKIQKIFESVIAHHMSGSEHHGSPHRRDRTKTDDGQSSTVSHGHRESTLLSNYHMHHKLSAISFNWGAIDKNLDDLHSVTNLRVPPKKGLEEQYINAMDATSIEDDDLVMTSEEVKERSAEAIEEASTKKLRKFKKGVNTIQKKIRALKGIARAVEKEKERKEVAKKRDARKKAMENKQAKSKTGERRRRGSLDGAPTTGTNSASKRDSLKDGTALLGVVTDQKQMPPATSLDVAALVPI